MPLKTCPQCQTKLGPRTALCGCGYNFKLKYKNSDDIPKSVKRASSITTRSEGDIGALEEEQGDQPADLSEVLPSQRLTADKPDRSIVRLVFVPSGIVPFKLQSTTKSAIIEWCDKIRQRGEEYGSYYTVDALCYYAKQLEVDDVDKVVRIIRQGVSDKFTSKDEYSSREYGSINVEKDNLEFGD